MEKNPPIEMKVYRLKPIEQQFFLNLVFREEMIIVYCLIRWLVNKRYWKEKESQLSILCTGTSPLSFCLCVSC